MIITGSLKCVNMAARSGRRTNHSAFPPQWKVPPLKTSVNSEVSCMFYMPTCYSFVVNILKKLCVILERYKLNREKPNTSSQRYQIGLVGHHSSPADLAGRPTWARPLCQGRSTGRAVARRCHDGRRCGSTLNVLRMLHHWQTNLQAPIAPSYGALCMR